MPSCADEQLAQAAVAALTGQLALAPKPGLPDPRDLAARVTGRDHRGLLWSARALAPGLAAMAAAARRTGEPTPRLRAELGAIGRCAEHSVGLAGGGHRGALWTLGLLVAAAALAPHARGAEVAATAKRIAAHPDRAAPRRPSRGATVSAKYGAAGARGEARAGFPPNSCTPRARRVCAMCRPAPVASWKRAARRPRRAAPPSPVSTPTSTRARGARAAVRASSRAPCSSTPCRPPASALTLGA